MKKIAKVSLSEINVQDDYSETLIKALKKNLNKQEKNSILILAENKPKKAHAKSSRY